VVTLSDGRVDRSEQIAVEGDAWEVENAWTHWCGEHSVRGEFYRLFATGYLLGKYRSEDRILAVRDLLKAQGRY
jgi:hypothetical protein